jgi:hypothetical protein
MEDKSIEDEEQDSKDKKSSGRTDCQEGVFSYQGGTVLDCP